MCEFDDKAVTWDDDPVRVERAEKIADQMKKLLDLRAYRSALEYGSGTGLLSFALKDQLDRITLMDASEGMTMVAKEKCEKGGVRNLFPIKMDLIEDEFSSEIKHDLIFTLLTLHHVDNTQELLSRFKKMMPRLGDLVIIDLETEDGSFHDDEFHGHLGFDRFELESQLREASFDPYHYEVIHEIEKDDGRKYPIFMMLARA